MSDTNPIPAASERERFEAWDSAQFEIDAEVYRHKHGERYVDRAVQCRWECWQARAALSHPSTPQGWKLVPVEPTMEMLDEMNAFLDASNWVLEATWKSALDAAPPPPEQGGKG